MEEHTYVECHNCKWQVENQSDRDWNEHPCPRCHNTRRIINPEELLCNMCGECMCHNIKTRSGTWSSNDPCGLYDAKVTGGYESYHLFDMTGYTFSFCEKCLRQLFNQCKIKPTVSDYCDVEKRTYEYDLEMYEYRLWQDEGGHHQAYKNGICNTRKDCPNKAVYTVYINDHFSEDCSCEDHKDRYTNSVSYRLVPFIKHVLKPFL